MSYDVVFIFTCQSNETGSNYQKSYLLILIKSDCMMHFILSSISSQISYLVSVVSLICLHPNYFNWKFLILTKYIMTWRHISPKTIVTTEEAFRHLNNFFSVSEDRPLRWDLRCWQPSLSLSYFIQVRISWRILDIFRISPGLCQSCEPCVTVEPLATTDNDPSLVGSYK